MKKYLMFILLFLVATAFSTTIYDVQYTTVPGPSGYYPSLLVGQTVTVTGLVSGYNFKGYKDNLYLIMPDGGAWSGVYVYACGDTNFVTGDELEITALVSEYFGLTELMNASSITLLSSGNDLPDPAVITTAQLAGEEEWEGVLVEVHDVVVTSAQNTYGEWYVTDVSATQGQMDDGFFYLDQVEPPIVINVGDTWAILRGMVNYSYDEFELNPRTPDDMIATLPLVCDFSADPLSGPVAL
ncbi:MAG: hypothetical protein Q7J16_10045, partial [Candidatus Cloacimonadales bacterium]|nr:hypothetical protein [Candidatus Cloacimonadales bacterium]